MEQQVSAIQGAEMSCILHRIADEGKEAEEVLTFLRETRVFLRNYLDTYTRGEDLRSLFPGAKELHDQLREMLIKHC